MAGALVLGFFVAFGTIGEAASNGDARPTLVATLARGPFGRPVTPVFAGPSGSSELIGHLGTPDGPPPVVVVTERSTDGWTPVQTPFRNSTSSGPTSGWISTNALAVRETDYRITIDRARHRVTVVRRGRVMRVMRAAVGASSRPTPAVDTFVVAVAKPIVPTPALGPFTLRLAAWSTVVPDYSVDGVWDGLVIQGTNCPKTCLGRNVTSGSIRVSNRDVVWLATAIDVGTPVRIR